MRTPMPMEQQRSPNRIAEERAKQPRNCLADEAVKVSFYCEKGVPETPEEKVIFVVEQYFTDLMLIRHLVDNNIGFEIIHRTGKISEISRFKGSAPKMRMCEVGVFRHFVPGFSQ